MAFQQWPPVEADSIILANLWPNTIFVDGVNGDDSNPAPNGYATITAALAAAGAGDRVMVLPNGTTYTEQFTVPAGVFLDARTASITSSASPGISLSNLSRLEVAMLNTAAAHVGIDLAAGEAVAVVGTHNVAAGGTGVQTAAGTELDYRFTRLNIAAGSFGIGVVTGNLGLVTFLGGEVHGTGAAGVWISTAAGSEVRGTAGAVVDDGGTITAFNALDGEVYVTCGLFDCDSGALVGAAGGNGLVEVVASYFNCTTTAYNVGLNGTFRLDCAEYAGAMLEAAGATISIFSSDMAGFLPAQAQITTPGGALTRADFSVTLDGSVGVCPATLPAAADFVGKRYQITAIDVTNLCSIVPAGTDLILGRGGLVWNNGGPFPFTAQYESVTLECDGLGWYIVATN